jgi:hypothetical protein
MAAKKPTAKTPGDAIAEIQFDVAQAEFIIRGRTPLLFNRMHEKAKRDLLYPPKRKNQAEREQTIKHNPRGEFRASVYKYAHDEAPTRLKFPSSAFKGVIKTAALDMPGAKKAQVGRLAWVEGQYVDLYGIPLLHMAVVRQAGMSKAPDIRTRAIVEQWCCRIVLNLVTPALTVKAIGNLMAQGGYVAGVGDGRQEKGALNFGQFDLCNEDDQRCAAIMRTGGREAQDAALAAAEPYDEEIAELLTWYDEEVDRRGRRKQLAELVGVDVNEEDDDLDEDEELES